MSVHIHKVGINKTLGQRSDAVISADLIGDFQPSAGINSAYWDNQASGNNNLRRYNSITYNNSTPHSFQFDGTDDYLGEASEGYGGSAFNVNAATAFTLAQWVKYNNVNHYAFIIDDGSNETLVLDILTSNDKSTLTISSSSNAVSDSTTFSNFTFSDDTWYYITLTHDGGGNYKFYVNGSFVGPSAIGECTANQALTIGKYSSNYTGAGTKIGHVHAYTVELSNSRIRQNFLATHKIHSDRIYGGTYTG